MVRWCVRCFRLLPVGCSGDVCPDHVVSDVSSLVVINGALINDYNF